MRACLKTRKILDPQVRGFRHLVSPYQMQGALGTLHHHWHLLHPLVCYVCLCMHMLTTCLCVCTSACVHEYKCYDSMALLQCNGHQTSLVTRRPGNEAKPDPIFYRCLACEIIDCVCVCVHACEITHFC